MYENTHFTYDAAVVSLSEEHDAIEQTDEGATIDWESVEQVRVDDAPYAEAFDTKTFYKLPATVARPIHQDYHYGADATVTLMKPRQELKQAAWSLDRRPITLGHPDSTMVKSRDQIHGFWGDVSYVDSVDDLDANAYVPVGDEEAKGWIEDNNDVSVGFHHTVEKVGEYDGAVGGTDANMDDLDGFQTDLYFNHCAFVKRGRCSDEDGCGLDSAYEHGTTVKVADDEDPFKYGTRINEDSDDTEDVTNDQDAPAGIYVGEDGQYFGISPNETADDSPKYELNNCSDVSDAWKLRGHGDYDVEQSTLETRIKRMADYHDCDMEFSDMESDSAIDALRALGEYGLAPCDCADCNCDDETESNMSFDIDFDDLTAEAALQKIGESHDGVADLADEVAEMREVVDTAEQAAETLDTDVENLDEVAQDVSEKATAYDEQKREEMEQKAGEIADIVDRHDSAEDVIDHYDGDYEAIDDQLSVLKEVTNQETDEESGDGEETTETTVDSQSGSGSEQSEGRTRKTPEAWSN